jgi:hypothetical protein
MSDTSMVAFAIVGGLVAIVAPLAVYALMPQKLLNLASEHGRYAGLGTAEPVDGNAGNTPVAIIGSLQGQSA